MKASETVTVARLEAEYGHLLTLAEVAARYGVKHQTAHKWALTGKLPFGRTPGGHVRVSDRVLPAPAWEPLKPGDPIPAERTGGFGGFVVAECGHRVAGSEWGAGFRTCERCPSGTAAAICDALRLSLDQACGVRS